MLLVAAAYVVPPIVRVLQSSQHPPMSLSPPPGKVILGLAETHFASLGVTPREREVMHWIIEGKRDREVATILGISSRTVEKHVCHIFEKLNVETRTAAARTCQYSIADQDSFGLPNEPMLDRKRRRKLKSEAGSPSL